MFPLREVNGHSDLAMLSYCQCLYCAEQLLLLHFIAFLSSGRSDPRLPSCDHTWCFHIKDKKDPLVLAGSEPRLMEKLCSVVTLTTEQTCLALFWLCTSQKVSAIAVI